MTSDPNVAPTEAFVWIWLPDANDPVVAGRIVRDGDLYIFNYGRSYLERPGAIPIYVPELPLERGSFTPAPPLDMANCLRDGAPDAWGRRVIINRLTGLAWAAARNVEFDELTYMLHSASDRIGALDFQASAVRYESRAFETATLEELQEAAERVERGEPIPPALDRALFHGSSIGGARPKAIIEDGSRTRIAKFSATSDVYNVVKAEFIAMRLAERIGLDAPRVELSEAGGKDVLLIDRFDRHRGVQGWTRRAMVSALTILGLHEMEARYAHYADLAEAVRVRFIDPKRTLKELFSRIVFNVLIGNTDDHARNHAAFWDGAQLTLTPAYDLCPQARTGREANQAMLIHEHDGRSRLATCRAAASSFLLDDQQAVEIIDAQIAGIREGWNETCDEAQLAKVDRDFLWRRQFLNDYAFEEYDDNATLIDSFPS